MNDAYENIHVASFIDKKVKLYALFVKRGLANLCFQKMRNGRQ